MRVQTGLFLLLVLALLCPSLMTCKRRQSPPVLEAVDPIDRRSNLPPVAPIARDLDEIKKAGTLTVLASYNCGAGHVDDAQRLAEKYGGNPQSWDDVSYWLLQESTQQYAADPVVKFGFCRGLEPVNYVTLLMGVDKPPPREYVAGV